MTALRTPLERIHYLAQFRQRPITLKQLFDFGSNPCEETLLTAAQFLHQELPVRLCHRVKELESLPFGLSGMPSVRLVLDMYIASVRDLIEYPRPESPADEIRFTQTIKGIKQRHNNVVPMLAKGVLELKRLRPAGIGPGADSDDRDPGIQDFLDRFYMSRIGIRMLIGQHIALHEVRMRGFVGLICEKCSPAEVAREAVEDASHLCLLTYGAAPEVEILGKKDLTFTYVPSHLHHMIFELLKNSMRAVMELHGPGPRRIPAIRVVIAEGAEDVTIKISDEGGGIPRSGISRIWTYLYTTAEPPPIDFETPYSGEFHAPLAGFGYGLPISRLYSRYFGGDLQVMSMEGYGTEAYLHLKRLGNTEEALP